MWNEDAIAYFQDLYQILAGVTEGNHENPQSV